MPSRIIREGILTSGRVNRLSSGAELFYRRLLNVVDDYGRYHAHPTLLRAGTFPMKMDVVKDEHVTKWLAEAVVAGLVREYTANGQKYLEVQDFGQKIRSKSKFPAPCQQDVDSLPADCPQDADKLPHVVEVVSVAEGVGTTLSDSGESDGNHEPSPAEQRFNDFWTFYPRKVGKGAAQKVFMRLKADDQTEAIEQAEAYGQAYELAPESRRQFFKHPATWLNARGWEDDHAEWTLLIEGK